MDLIVLLMQLKKSIKNMKNSRKKCPFCNKRVYDPFFKAFVIHNINNCKSFYNIIKAQKPIPMDKCVEQDYKEFLGV